MKIQKAYRLKLYPTKAQASSLARFGGSCRWLWNHLLHANKERYQHDGTFAFYHEMATSLPALKREHPWLTDTPAASLQRVCRNMDSALKNCFQHGKGFPRPKRKHDLSDAFYLTNQQVRDVERIGRKTGRVKIPKIGSVKVRGSRFPEGKILGANVRMHGGSWWIAVQCEVEIPDPAPLPANPTAIGVDLGLKEFAVLSDGTAVANPRRLRRAEKRLARKQRQVARSRKGSRNRRKKVLALRRLHAKVRQFRSGFLHEFTTRLTAKADVICVEDLAIKGLARTRLAKSIADAGWGEALRQLDYKTEWAGKALVKIDRFAPSSQTCSSCGHRQTMPLRVRTFNCGSCGAVLDRDLNAARNIERWGIETFGTVGGGTAEPPSLTATPGDDRSAGVAASAATRHRSMKRELTVALDARSRAA